jgi:hypothetical protein
LGIITKMTNLKKLSVLIPFALLLTLIACEESKPPAPAPKKTNQFETGMFAIYKMIPGAHLWSEDAAPIRLESTVSNESNGQDGKSGFWRASFGSRSRSKMQAYTWSGMADAPRKVDHGIEESYNPNNRSLQTWDLHFLKVDTDKAFETAQAHGGKDLTSKDPKQPVTYVLDWDSQANQLRWHVMYGANPSTTKLTVLVDASSGAYLRKE